MFITLPPGLFSDSLVLLDSKTRILELTSALETYGVIAALTASDRSLSLVPGLEEPAHSRYTQIGPSLKMDLWQASHVSFLCPDLRGARDSARVGHPRGRYVRTHAAQAVPASL